MKTSSRKTMTVYEAVNLLDYETFSYYNEFKRDGKTFAMIESAKSTADGARKVLHQLNEKIKQQYPKVETIELRTQCEYAPEIQHFCLGVRIK